MRHSFLFILLGVLTFAQTSDLKIGKTIEGNFKGIGNKITATVFQTQEHKGNPLEDGTPAAYEIRFSDKNMKAIKAGCCEVILVNEGDLNRDGTDELSLYQAPMNGCTYTMSTYSYIKNSWKQVVKPFLIQTGCDNSHDNLQGRIIREKKGIFYYQNDLNDGNGKLIRKKVVLKN